MKETYITGTIQAGSSRIPQVATHLQLIDYLGAMMVRWSINRNGYLVSPGLYAVGNPDSASDVFVAANYKLSFDTLRKNLAGLNAWILVLDTRGINVWCAAGKGTFGTAELVNRIRLTSLEMIVTHRRLIVPQLGAVGVSAHRVKKETGAVESSAVKPAATKSFTDISFSGTSIKANRGFTVKYGPVRASDIKKYLAAGYKTCLLYTSRCV